VAPNSRSPPAILHACREARQEALKYYELENFENKATAYGVQYTHFIYYNRQVDIVDFGEQSNIETLDAVLRLGIEIPNMAISYDHHWTSMKAYRDLRSPHGFKILHLLHGYDEADNQYTCAHHPVIGEHLGAGGLQKMLFVLPSFFPAWSISQSVSDQLSK
jgi:hypothetical protein